VRCVFYIPENSYASTASVLIRVRVEGKTIYVRDGIDEKPFEITSVKPHHTPRDISARFMFTTHAVLRSFLHGSPLHTPILPAANPVSFLINLTEILTLTYPRRFDPRLRASK
jgi:hypothetical protein